MSKARDLASLLSASGDVKASALDNVASSGTADFVASGTLPNGAPVILKADGTVAAVAQSSTADNIPASDEVSFHSTTVFNLDAAFDPSDGSRFVVVWKDGASTGYGTAVVGTVSGTSITFGSKYVFNAGNTDYSSVSFDPNTAGKFVVAYRDLGFYNKGVAVVGTVSGTSLSFGTESMFNDSQTYDISAKFDPNTAGQFVVAFRDGGNSSYGTCVVGTVSGTALSYSTAVVFQSGYSSSCYASFDPNTPGSFVVAYRSSDTPDYGSVVVGTIAAGAVSFGSEITTYAGYTTDHVAMFDPNTAGQFVVAFGKGLGGSSGVAVVGHMASSASNLTATNFIGTSTDAYTNGQTASIMFQGGLSTNQSGLTVGSTYYVQEDGTLATTADTISVFAGKAVSATSLLLESPPALPLTGGAVTGTVNANAFVGDGSGLTNLPSSGGGGGWTEISSTTVSSAVAQIEYTLSGYSVYKILYWGCNWGSNDNSFAMDITVGSGSYSETLKFHMHRFGGSSSANHDSVYAGTGSILEMWPGTRVDSSNGSNFGEITIFNTTGMPTLQVRDNLMDDTSLSVGITNAILGFNSPSSTDTIGKIKLIGSQGNNFEAGNFTLYGLN